MTQPQIRATVSAIMPEALQQLGELVAYPSLGFDGYPVEPSLECAQRVYDMVSDLGVDHIELLDVGGNAPTVWAEIKGDDQAPTVLLYAHYDVQPAGPEQGWKTDPFTLTRGADGRYYGRGAADDKSGIIQHLTSLRAVGGAQGVRPLNIKLCIEGEEECHGTLDQYIKDNPERFAADIFMIADTGNLQVGKPVLTTSMRGDVNVDVKIRTIQQALHSGLYGGPTPDALKTLIRTLDSLWDDHGNTAIAGLIGHVWDGADYPEDLLTEQVGLVGGSQFVGTGSLGSRLWSQPSASIIGIDAPSIAQAANIIIPEATARVAVRFPWGQSETHVVECVKSHLKAHCPDGAEITFPRTVASPAFVPAVQGEYTRMFKVALGEAFGTPASDVGCGASIPMLNALQEAAPQAEFLEIGASDMELAKIHGGNESVDPQELERCILAQALFFKMLVDRI